MSSNCPDCGNSLGGLPILNESGDKALAPMDIVDGTLVLKYGVKCDECGWDQVVTIEPESVDDDPGLEPTCYPYEGDYPTR